MEPRHVFDPARRRCSKVFSRHVLAGFCLIPDPDSIRSRQMPLRGVLATPLPNWTRFQSHHVTRPNRHHDSHDSQYHPRASVALKTNLLLIMATRTTRILAYHPSVARGTCEWPTRDQEIAVRELVLSQRLPSNTNQMHHLISGTRSCNGCTYDVSTLAKSSKLVGLTSPRGSKNWHASIIAK